MNMQVKLLENIEFFGLFLGLVAFFIAAYCLWKQNKLSRLQKAFFRGKTGMDLENLMLLFGQKITALENESLLASASIKNIQENLNFTVQKVGLVRYSPFNDGGGNYSFSLALLDANNSGIILTNMYGRQQSRVYTKKLESGKSEMPLTEEEQAAVNFANKQKAP